MPLRAHLGVEAVGFAQVALATGRVAPSVRQLGAQLFEPRPTALAARVVDELRCAVEGGADLAGGIRFRRSFSQQDAGQDELSITLKEWRCVALSKRDRFAALLLRSVRLAQAEVRFREELQEFRLQQEVNAPLAQGGEGPLERRAGLPRAVIGDESASQAPVGPDP